MHGVILVTAGSYSNVIRLLMPLVISDDQMDEGLDVIENALVAAGSAQPAVAGANVPVGVA